MFRGRLIGAFACIVAMTAPTVSRSEDQDAIDYRQHVMKTLNAQTEIIGMILKHKAPAVDLATHARILAITAATAKSAFEPKISGGNAKAEVWAQWPDFVKRLDALAAATDDLAKIAKEGGVAATSARFESALTCKSCHDTYRVPIK